ncbi:(Fe-S)-binding protein [Idiomarina piscisalsi]|uniref:(Fe-S)-binding protein n=1 Tax=Idiomarina piscisalsi TaxID=1096243 RepID=A0ABM6LV78_9GAMM|nr:SufE family protein [Idiomarina piscisalsi]ASG66455.1 (Fe-S)-binding protein [Idiomarina piscisalsi]
MASWEQLFRQLVQQARSLAEYPSECRDDDHLVGGCEAKVWLWLDTSDSEAVVIRFDSESRIVRGLLAMLQQRLDGCSVAEIAAFDIDAFYREEGLDNALSPSRSNGLYQVAKTLKLRAQPLQ